MFCFFKEAVILKEVEINERIKDSQVRVLDENGVQLGILATQAALKMATEKNLDLVKINPSTQPPICKIMDYGKFKFDLSKKEKDTRKKQKASELKEIRLSMTIDVGDVETKARHAVRFLTDGDKVKVSIRMKGRQQVHANIGVKVMEDFFALTESVSIMEKKPLTEGRNIVMILAPKQTKN